jgi:hypothetical protein
MTDDEGVSFLREWVGDTLIRFAVGYQDVKYDDLVDAVEMSMTLEAETLAELFDPRRRYYAELFCSP